MFSGLTSFIQYIVEPDVLQGVVYWTMGSFSRCLWDSVAVGAVTTIAGTVLICLCIKELNLISIGEDQAEALGVNIRRTRTMLLIGTALTVGGGVAIAGIIGFVGLIIPHICRAIAGPDHRLHFRRVVFPHPFSPRIPRILPFLASNVTSLRIGVEPYPN